MGYPETGQVTEIVPPSTDFTEGMGRTRGGPARRKRRKKMRWRLSLGSAKGGMDGRGVEPWGDYEAPFRGGKVLQYRKVGDERVTLN